MKVIKSVMMRKVVVAALAGAYMAFIIVADNCPSSSSSIFICPDNCSEFIRCQGSTPIRMACPAHLQYDPNIQKCNYPDKIQIPKNYCEDPTNIYEKPHYCDCTKYVYCVYGKGAVVNCPSPKKFSSTFAAFNNICNCTN
ncbi:unnamed protein product [Phyllotreta striolata]|uniref:Chitin-binding type-2 domain-containing protein n=1 Tax=Phyllotreta striolata TaxID=444603 RepID=A0A9N9TRS7_PHYSR|nr:unnamed protein product [Phyllotreta striolata]